MRKLACLLLLALITKNLPAQTKDSTLNRILKAMNNFQERERKRDSVLQHPLGSNSEADYFRRFSFYDSVNKELNKINDKTLAFPEQINLELIKYSIEDNIYSWKYKAYLNPILSDEGFHTRISRMGSQVYNTKKEYENYISRLKDIPRYVDEYLALMREGLKLGISQPRNILNGYENTYMQHIVSDVTQSVFWKPFVKKPSVISEEDWLKLQADGAKAIMDKAVDGYAMIKMFFDKEYLPKTKAAGGVSTIPNGIDYYKELVHHYTTTDLSYEEIYQLGLREVERIKEEMEKVVKQANFNGTMQEFIAYLRTDPKFYATTPEQLLKEASFIAKKADGALPRFFGKLPRQPYGVEPVPADLAPTYTAGRYSGAPISSRRPGNYWVNTYDLKSRPFYALESLTLHEAVPGHHLQGALSQELDSLPAFRRGLYVNAFGEGWGLYCEYLGHEMGFYKDPYSLFGRLTYEMWRACRLVLDVALHTKGWTREEAVKYLAENTALSLHEVNTEINRYISWPGQALAYKMGEIKIKQLRRLAENALKDKFDIREFHDLILSQGTVTLKILEGMVANWVVDKKVTNKSPSN